ncbi:YbfB/YjiJ family MFS transporter [Ottowia sp.]|uniref:YbfB/YjiJ family MFS transporter n=1 Tax=Ottowia sp. TaxID=1898956 RepID=UPI0039E41165
MSPQPPISLWPAFGLGLSIAVGNGLARFAYALVLPAMREDLGWNYAQAGWLNTANALGYLAGAASGYLLLRRLPAARLFSLGLVLTLLALPATALSAQLGWLSATRLLAGIGAAWVFSCGSALVAGRYRHHPARGGTATGLFFAGAGLGIALSGLAVSPLLAWAGAGAWPQAWLLLGLAAALLSIWPLREARRPGDFSSTVSTGALPLRGLWMPLLGYFAFAAGYIVYMTFILAWMGQQGWPWHAGLGVWLVLGGGVALSPFVWRAALNRWPPSRTLSASCLATLAGAAIPLLDAGGAGLLCSAAVFGLGVFIAPSAIAVLVRQRMPPGQWAKGMTLFTVVFATGQAIGPVAAGWIADARSLDASLLFGVALLLVAALLPMFGAPVEDS